MRSIVGVLLSALLVVGTVAMPVAVAQEDPFSDVPASHLFADDIGWLAAEGITRGCNPPDNTRFCPDASVTRGQMAAFLVRALDLAAGTPRFSDTASSVFTADIDALAAAGVTRGCNPPDNSRFCPDDVVTRGQMAAFLVRALGLGSTESKGFSDTVGDVFEGDIDALAEAGITRGCNPPDNSRFCPDDPVTRGQMAAFLHRALGDRAPLAISTTSLATGSVGAAYNLTLAAVGGVPPYTWTATGLPAGLTVGSTGVITGTPEAPGEFSVTLRVTDSASQTASVTLSIAVEGVVAVSAGQWHTCGLDKTGTAWCWGLGDDGRLGNDATSSSDEPVQVEMPEDSPFVAIQSGGSHTCALDSSGHAWCWGKNQYGQLGNGSNDNAHTPTEVSGGIEFESITTGRDHTCALDGDGIAYCWGSNFYGELGRGTFDSDGQTSPGPVITPLAFDSITAGSLFTCGVATDGSGRCWGVNSDGRLGNGDSPNHSLVPSPIVGSIHFTSLTAGDGHACGTDIGGGTYCWGWNANAQVGDGTSGNFYDVPMEVDSDVRFESLGLGSSHSCGVNAGGELYCWGYNVYGQLGDGNPPGGSWTPTPAATTTRFVAVSGGESHTCGVSTVGAVYCWGLNADGQLGNGDAGTDSSTPGMVVGFP